ncbi:hypothetical protein [Halocynthiibacter sp.]|uniref:hypothetical protein n=1 Tax=Halocynthiibacter sp. TaxID=1979210 RepID=UPI003C429F99
MLFNNRVKSVRYDLNVHKYEGEFEFASPGGDTCGLRIAMVTEKYWPFERVHRNDMNVTVFGRQRQKNGWPS